MRKQTRNEDFTAGRPVTRTVAARMPIALRERLNRRAKAEGNHASAVLRRLLVAGLNAEDARERRELRRQAAGGDAQ